MKNKKQASNSAPQNKVTLKVVTKKDKTYHEIFVTIGDMTFEVQPKFLSNRQFARLNNLIDKQVGGQK